MCSVVCFTVTIVNCVCIGQCCIVFLQENAALALRLEELQDDIQSTETEKRYKISTDSHCHQKDNFIYTLSHTIQISAQEANVVQKFRAS